MVVSRHLLSALCAPTLAWASWLPKQSRAFPGSADWLSDREWSHLNKAVSGRLLKPELPGGVCHEGQPNYDEDEDQCPNIVEGCKTMEFHASDPVSVMRDQFANQTCLPDVRCPCSGQGYPAYVANATTAKHVKAAVDFGKHAPYPQIHSSELTDAILQPRKRTSASS